MNIIFSSCGNDSVALIQWCIQKGLTDLHIAYSDTGWSSKEWPKRVEEIKNWSESFGASFHVIESVGFEAMCLDKKNQAFPRDGMQFCTTQLKIQPAMDWLEQIDPEKDATCLVGIRRSESARRSQWPEWTFESDKHGGRDLWAPLVRHSDDDRNVLLRRAGVEILPYRSRECWPCVNSSKSDLRDLTKHDVEKVAKLEQRMGVGKRSGKPKFMFRSEKCGGAKGIVEVVKWASHTKYIEGQDDLFGGGCDSGFCGD